ncbi:MAG TPA: methanogenesis multiheme c-type cytochrome, partial [Methanomethylovorans sp.]|nr:methanogenesis multiheme c-type cytochrome [Methanomethylovorans sp.]
DVGLANPLICADCHAGSASGTLHINWELLGYDMDPAGTTAPAQEISVTIPGQKPVEVEREPAL